MDRIFKIDFRKLAVEWLIIPLRTIWLMNFIFVIIEPIKLLYIDFLTNRKQNLLRLSVTNQKFSMQKHLNDLFDKLERRIEIVKAVQFDGLYFYTKAEDDPFFNKTEWLKNDYPLFLRSKSELYSEFDFLVKIPDAGINLFQLKSEIEYFMLQSKNYKIEIV